MAKTKNLREALLGQSKSAIESGRSAVSGVGDAGGAVWLPVGEIAPDSAQPRTHYDEEAMRKLCESIASLGQIEPVVVQALGPAERDAAAGKRYRCLSGHRRLRAHEMLGLSEIKAAVVRERLADTDRFRQEIASNEVREDHTDFDRARFMSLVFADALALAGDETERGDRVKYLVNRAFNEYDRTGRFSAESEAVVHACERALAALGERRNLRWFHRWGLPILALRGAAREAAVAGLDARRTLAVARLAGKATHGRAANERDRVLARVARVAREHDVASRDLAAAVKALAARLDAGTLTDGHLELVLSSLARPAADEPDTPDGVASAKPPSSTKRARARHESLGERADALARRWSVAVERDGGRSHATGKGRTNSLVEVVAAAEARSPSAAARFVALLERADAELSAILARPEPKRRRGR